MTRSRAHDRACEPARTDRPTRTGCTAARARPAADGRTGTPCASVARDRATTGEGNR